MYSAEVITVLICVFTPSEVLDSDEVLARAEAAFREGAGLSRASLEATEQFRTSAACYEELRRRGAHNADLYRNQGNAYFLAGDVSRAILAYRRGLRLRPSDSELQANLAHARDQVVYASADAFARPPVEHWPPWLPHPSVWRGVAPAFLFFSMACLAVTGWRMTRQGWLLAAGSAALVFAALFAAAIALEDRRLRQDVEHPLVVVAHDSTFLRKGNGAAYPPSYEVPLHRGVEARLLFVRGDWLQIELTGREVGWVSRADVLLDQ